MTEDDRRWHEWPKEKPSIGQGCQLKFTLGGGYVILTYAEMHADGTLYDAVGEKMHFPQGNIMTDWREWNEDFEE